MLLTRMFSVVLVLGMMLSGCASTPTETSASADNSAPEDTSASPDTSAPADTLAPAENNKILILYFSQSGNTRTIADQINQTVGGDLLEIKTVTPYPADYETLMDTALNEQNEDARPALETQIDNLASYDTIFIGYPIWFGKMPMVFSTLFEEYDFTDKTIIPFCTFGGNGGVEQSQQMFRDTVTDIGQLAPQSTVLDGLAIQGSAVGSAGDDVSAWLGTLGL